MTECGTVPEPYLHVGDDRIFNPLSGVTLAEGEAGYRELRELIAGTMVPAALAGEMLDLLCRHRWLVGTDTTFDARFRLEYVSLETHTVCNHACYFCPVASNPRQRHFMSPALFTDVLQQLGAYRDTIKAVFLNNYNEPTVDPRLIDQLRALGKAGLPPALLTNGSGLAPRRVDELVEMAVLHYLGVNLSTLDRERFASERGVDQLPLVLRNLDYLKDKPLAPRMEIMVLGTGDRRHQEDFEAIRERFAGSRLRARYEEVMDRAGHLSLGHRPGGVQAHDYRLCGCRNMGSRPLQHLHVTPQGRCLLCCEDYDEAYVTGDLTTTPLAEILAGPAYQRLRRWAYGRDSSPSDFICKKCVFALRQSSST